MKLTIRNSVKRAIGALSRRATKRQKQREEFACELALETMIKSATADSVPNELFSDASDELWFWLNTEGVRKSSALNTILPSMPSEHVQLRYTGAKGDTVLKEAFDAYTLFKETYEKEIGPLSKCRSVLDFGCGWGRITRFFMKDVDSSRIWACDPVQDMIDICRESNRWCNFDTINTRPPSPYEDDKFDLIFSFSVFSHLSEDMHKMQLDELYRILRPGGLLIVTTRQRKYIKECAAMRNLEDLESLHEGPRSSASAFLDTQEHLSDYDSGKYCFSQLVHEGEWSYWGEAAIPKEYVMKHWTKRFTFRDFIDDETRCAQCVVVLKKP